MGFRFSRRVSILPGLKLNFSGSGVSLSAGIPGAHLNFGSHGTYASVGLPGTGLSYRQRVGGGPSGQPGLASLPGNPENDGMVETIARFGNQNTPLSEAEARRYAADPRLKLMDPETGQRITPARLEARIKANDRKEKLEKLQLELDQRAENYDQLLNFWHPLPEIAGIEQWSAAQTKQPFESKLAAPTAPDLDKAHADLLTELTAKHAASGLGRLLPGFVASHAAEKELAAVWPERAASIQAEFDRQTQAYNQAIATEAAAWDEAETKRTEWIARLVAGDVEETHHTLAEVLGGMQLPFKLHCDFFLHDALTVFLQLELPVLEEVIPETQTQLSAHGEPCDTRRTKAERQADYTRLALGECVFLAAECFSYLPRAVTVHVSGYTQRPRERETDPIDSYLLDAAFQRSAVIEFAQGEQNLLAFFVRQGGRFKQNTDGGLERIEPPSWITHEDYRHLG